MTELRGAMTHHDLAGHTERSQGLALELVGVDPGAGLRREVQLHVDQCAGEVLDGGEALVEVLGALDLGDELGRDRLAGLVVDGVALEDLLGRQPMFEQLRGEFDIVPRHRCAGDGRVVDVGGEAMQRVTELVEQRHSIVPTDEHRLAGLALHEVGIVGDEGGDLAVEALLFAIGVHPRAGLLADAGVGVEVPEADMLAREVADRPDRDIGVVDRYGARCERLEDEAEELLRHEEHAFTELVELQIGLELVGVEVVLGLADLLRIEPVVPGLEGELDALGVGDTLHVGDLLTHPRNGGLPDRLHQRHGAFRGASHGVLETPVRMRRVAEQSRTLGAQLQDLADDRVVVARIAVVAAAHELAPDLLAQVATGGVGEEGLDG